LEASALARAPGRGLLARRSPLLRFESDERLVALIRAGHDGAFEALFNRYHSRLLGFCQSMLKSRQDAEDVLQEVFTNAHHAMLGDERKINVRPWLYRIARNRCLNHLRRPVPEGQDSMDVHPHQNGTTTAEQVQSREELRHVLADVRTLPETQRTALLLREIDQLSYEEIAVAMDTTVPAVKSLLVRARIALAESSQARMLTCEEVQVELAEAAEGLGKASGPARKHVRSCEGCCEFRDQLRSDRKALAALFPLGPLALIKGGLLSKLFGGSGAAGGGAAGSGAAGAAGGASAAGGMSSVSGGLGALGGAIGAKAAAGVATAALLTAGAVEVRQITAPEAPSQPAAASAPAIEHFSPDRLPAAHRAPSHLVASPPTAPSGTAGAATRPAAPEPSRAAPEKAPADPAVADPAEAAPAESAPAEPRSAPFEATSPDAVPSDGEASIEGPGAVDPGPPRGEQETGAAPADPVEPAPAEEDPAIPPTQVGQPGASPLPQAAPAPDPTRDPATVP